MVEKKPAATRRDRVYVQAAWRTNKVSGISLHRLQRAVHQRVSMAAKDTRVIVRRRGDKPRAASTQVTMNSCNKKNTRKKTHTSVVLL